MSIWLDIAVVLLLVISIYIGVKRGAFLTLSNLLCSVLAIVAASFISKPISEFIYSTFFKQGVTENISSALEKATGDSGQDPISAAIGALPEHIQNAAANIGIPNISTPNANDLTNEVESFVSPLFVSFISVFVVIICVFLLGIIIRWIFKKLNLIFKLPVLKQVNSLAGALVGLAFGVLLILFIVYIIAVCSKYISQMPEIFSQNTIQNSNVFVIIYDFVNKLIW